MTRIKEIMPAFSLFFSAVLSSFMLALGIPNELFSAGSALFGIFCLVPLYTALIYAKSFALSGLICGTQIACVHLFSSFWLANFKDFAIFTLGASTIAYFGLGVLIGWCLKTVLCSRKNLRPFAFAACWVCWEWLKSTGFLGYPWGTLSMTSLSMRRFIQIADTTGIWGISFLFALASAVAAELLLPENRWLLQGLPRALKAPTQLRLLASSNCLRAALFAAALFALSVFYGFYALSKIPEPEGSFAASLIQQNSDPWGEDGDPDATLQDLQNLTRNALADWEELGKKPDIVIWSESSLPYAYNINRRYYSIRPAEDPFLSFLRETGVYLFTGSPFIETENGKRRSFNAAILIRPDDGEIEDWYGKIQLVPFAEYVPFSDNEFLAGLFERIVGFSSGWTPGKKRTVFTITAKGDGGTALEIPFTAPICFEDAFPAVTARLHKAGGKVLINLTNDSWSKTESAEYQHYAVASFRAIELRTTMIRSTNGGFTAIILPSGEILASLPLFERAFLNAEVPVYPAVKTFYIKFGDWFAGLCAIFAVAAVIDALRQKKGGLLIPKGAAL